MMKLLAALMFCFLLAPIVPAYAQSGSLTGDWRGVYFAGGQADTPFEVNLSEAGGHISGTITEPNTFGTPDARFLLATLEGTVIGGAVTFIKTYDGTGGESHSVQYSGRLMPGGRRIVGTWSLQGAQGNFEMVR